MFFAAYAPNVPQGTHPVLESIDGGVAPVAIGSDYNSGESDIDFDLAFSLTYPQTITLYQGQCLYYSFNSQDSMCLTSNSRRCQLQHLWRKRDKRIRQYLPRCARWGKF